MSASYGWRPVRPEQTLNFKDYMTGTTWERLEKVFSYEDTNGIALGRGDLAKLETLHALYDEQIYKELIELIETNGSIKLLREW